MTKFWTAVFNRRMLICIFTGIASGMPLFLIVQLIPAWLRFEGVGLAEIGFFALIGLPYTWKFAWAPLLDRYCINSFGRRRTWMLFTQLALIISISFLPQLSTDTQLWSIAYLSAIVAFFSATQDIAIDAYRREILPDEELGLGNSVFVTAYRVSVLVPGSLGLILSDHIAWELVFPIVAIFMMIGVITTCLISEPEGIQNKPQSLKEAVVTPFKEFFARSGWKSAIFILLFIFLYKLGDNLATALSTPFYIDLGFSGTEIGIVAKHAALWPSIFGGILGGLLMIKIGINRALWAFGVVQILSILGFAILAKAGGGLTLLAIVIAFEYLGVGLGTAAIVAFMAREASKAHSATQLALFTALAALPRTVANASTGLIVESIGWENFFYLCTLCAIPGMLLLIKVAPWTNSETA